MLPPFPSKLPLAQLPSPLRPLDRLSELLGGPRIWIKNDDMTGSTLSGNKVRKLEYVVARAQEAACDTLITCGGLQSNHCRATALVGAQLGLNVHLILRGRNQQSADGNLLLDYLAGAAVSTYSPEEYFENLEQLFAHWRKHYEAQGRRVWCIPTGASDAYGLWGYIEASVELQKDFEKHQIKPGLLVCATGSGGTQAGLTLGFALQNSPISVLGMAVCDDEKYFYEKARADIGAWAKTLEPDYYNQYAEKISGVSISTNAKYIGPGYARAYPEIYETIQLVANTEGQVLDPVYTAKAFYGLLSEIKKGNLSQYNDLVFVHTGGIFGMYPYREALMEKYHV